MRAYPCAVCGFSVILDLDNLVQSCQCKINDSLPQWLKTDAWTRAKWLKQYKPVSPEFYQCHLDLLKKLQE